MEFSYQIGGNISEVLDVKIKRNKSSNVGYLYFPHRYVGKTIRILIIEGNNLEAVLNKTVKQNNSSNVGYIYLPEQYSGKSAKVLVLGGNSE